MSEKGPPRISENQLISPKRYSDESKEPKSGMIRKKSGFSGFMSSIGVGSPRGVKISAPENPVHVTHVGYDNQTGQFTVSLCLHRRRLVIQLLIDLGPAKGMAAHDKR
jgi:p21-activated kinase 1